MRAFLAAFGLLMLAAPGRSVGKCASWAYWAWPPSGTVPTNTLILLDVYGSLVGSLTADDSGGAELRGGGEVIPLEPQLAFAGQMAIEQVLYKPVRPLTPGVEYRLFAEAVREGALADSDVDCPAPYRWVGDDGADTSPPIAVGPPAVVGSRHIPFGCGPEIEVDVRLPVRDESALLAMVYLSPARETDGASGTYLLPIVDGVVSIGHGMCSGAFRLQPGGDYSVRFEILDVAGNLVLPWQAPVTIHVPVEYVE